MTARVERALKCTVRDRANLFEQFEQISRFNGGSVCNSIVLGASASRACSVALGNVYLDREGRAQKLVENGAQLGPPVGAIEVQDGHDDLVSRLPGLEALMGGEHPVNLDSMPGIPGIENPQA